MARTKKQSASKNEKKDIPSESVVDDSESFLPAPHQRGTFSKGRIFVVLLLLLVIISGIFFAHRSYFNPEAVANREAERQKAENEELIEEVGKLMILPQEEPLIYQIDDPELLMSEQPFFVGAEEGDKLIVYPNAAKAIIYSQTRKMIVNVGPVTFDEGQVSNVRIEPSSPPPPATTSPQTISSSSTPEVEDEQEVSDIEE
ncbi:hypothetical protein A2837_00410 [Candidatus Kaiserbacteria bacterium RIFCSPHIGHO2_01_FULL_46_22]|uniref:Uncharacterized protein n=1 Tax=Candidatus Kaiserbacteria bacterium RIFCSPHIGHO2_01_FULL_46_22 TaxID=1798475 RepID=A0A1F6BXC3_9BACT|nr:MAG: hypothetical protein A2837_00410 [Candidatus Kaiserbacteria bacterium RIFCSPHIGHO2_01_FULL_46_22]